MDILTLKSKVKLGCSNCNRCCIHRGDIKLIPINVWEICSFLKISVEQFLKEYTENVRENNLEIVIKATGEEKMCIFYDEKNKKCKIHHIKPMQCVMFPLVPENLKRDYFYDSRECKTEEICEITVNKWVNGNNKIYKKNKKIYMEWIFFIEWIQEKINDFSKEDVEEIFKQLFENDNLKRRNYIKKMRKNIEKVEKNIKNKKTEI